MIFFAAVFAIVLKDLALSIIAAIIPQGKTLSYLGIWLLNAVISYLPPLLTLGVVFLETKPRFELPVNESPQPPRRFDWRLLPAFLVSMYFLCMSANLLTHLAAAGMSRIFGTGELPDVFESVIPASNYEWLIMLVFVGIVAAVAEEFLYRHLLLLPLRKFGDRQAVVITAVLFGAFHGNLTQFLYAAVAGLVLGIVTVRSNSLKPAIALHMANNMFNVGLAAFPNVAAIIVPWVILTGLIATVLLFIHGQFRVRCE
jgi:membrane protease YdiL (CAAX protease family)